MSTPTLTELLVPQTSDDILLRLLAYLQGIEGFPITDWNVGGVERTIAEYEADALADLVTSGIPALAAGGLATEAAKLATTDWLKLLAHEMYQLDYYPATRTRQNLRLTCAAGFGPVTITAGALWVYNEATGNRYVSVNGGTLPDADDLDIVVESEYPNNSTGTPSLNYTDAAGTLTHLSTPIPGVTCTNPTSDFSAVEQFGSGPGTITPSRTAPGTPPTAHSFAIEIIVSGGIGVGTARYSMDGAASVTIGSIPTYYDLPGGTRITFAGSFVAKDIYVFSTPESPIVVQGTDEENAASLLARMQARWPSLSLVPTEDKFITWARAADVQVTRVQATASPTVPGQVDIVLAGQGGTVGAPVVAAVLAYINMRIGIGETVVVTAAAATLITPAGTVTVPSGSLVVIQTAAQIAWDAYVSSIPIAGTLELAKLAQILMEAGASNVTLSTLKLNTVAADLVLAAGYVAQVTGALSSQLTWTLV